MTETTNLQTRTFAAVQKYGEVPVQTFVDSTTPDGHFLAVTKVVGLVTTYLLRGTEGDPEAPIIGRIESPAMDKIDTEHASHYAGGGIKGGTFIYHQGLSGDAFATMVALQASHPA